MSFVVLKTKLAASVAAGGAISFPYSGTNVLQADFTAGQTATLGVYAREFPGLAVSFDADAAVVTWPVDAPYPFPAGEHTVQFDLVGPDVQGVMEAQADSVNGGVADSVAATVAALVVDFNALLVKYNGLVTEHNALLAKARAAGLMDS